MNQQDLNVVRSECPWTVAMVCGRLSDGLRELCDARLLDLGMHGGIARVSG